MTKNVSDTDLKEAYIRAAKILALHGETYLPIFQRLEQEFNKRKEEAEILDRAIEIALSVDTS